ncbi:hypothetical protein [Engelhardtia mirabilis]|uniref:Uncharacterized protein n=1 Tax=Engelhardtia mirabilis TaxID=2528011 RepID=A0A518BL91_9BACT|nr:hypothetical protein Pla133_28110 [Planctomycetes bacterium Pla133]QDV02049.1 hypothetical protein Pla86_28100 [Planctomycetes bacterium Pla86]
MARKPLPDSWKAIFLEAYERERTMQRAALVAGVSRRTVFNSRETDSEFDAAIREVQELMLDDLEDAAMTRAIEGTLDPVYYEGIQCGERTKHHDALAMFILKQRRPGRFNLAPGRDRIDEQSDAGQQAYEFALSLLKAQAEIRERNGCDVIEGPSEEPENAEEA